jgi:hypothetical protein
MQILTRDQISNVRWILERAPEFHEEVYLCFIDYSKAFDCVDHDTLFNSLRDMGFPEHLIRLLSSLYKNQEATVRTQYGDTESFGIGKGVRQECILSPTLFNLYAEEIMREAGLEEMEEGVRIGGRNINNLRYADDTTLAANKKADLQKLLERVIEASKKAGLQLNIKKTKVMSNAAMDTFTVYNEEIEVVENFNLLGATIEGKGDCSTEIKRRLVLGRVAMVGLDKIWKDKNISTSKKRD